MELAEAIELANLSNEELEIISEWLKLRKQVTATLLGFDCANGEAKDIIWNTHGKAMNKCSAFEYEHRDTLEKYLRALPEEHSVSPVSFNI